MIKRVLFIALAGVYGWFVFAFASTHFDYESAGRHLFQVLDAAYLLLALLFLVIAGLMALVRFIRRGVSPSPGPAGWPQACSRQRRGGTRRQTARYVGHVNLTRSAGSTT